MGTATWCGLSRESGADEVPWSGRMTRQRQRNLGRVCAGFYSIVDTADVADGLDSLTTFLIIRRLDGFMANPAG